MGETTLLRSVLSVSDSGPSVAVKLENCFYNRCDLEESDNMGVNSRQKTGTEKGNGRGTVGG